MREILKIAALMLLIYILASSIDYGYIFRSSEGFVMLFAISVGIYFIFKPARKPAVTANEPNILKPIIVTKPTAVISNKPGANTGKRWMYAIILFIVFVYLLQNSLGNFSFKFFRFLDNIFRVGQGSDPVFMWGLIGLFAGLVCGSFIAWRKYRLPFKVNLIPAGIFLLMVFLLMRGK